MALAAATVWEVRPTVGADTNGGGFVTGASGTDWSQQNAAQYALSNGVTNGTATIGTVSASADMVGNIVYVTGGTGSVVANWYQIVSAIAGVSITVDRSTGLTAGTGVTLNIGGALATIAGVFATATACNIFWIKNTGNLTVSVALQPAFQNNPSPMQFIGYGTTRGDTGRATWTTSTNSIHLVNFQSGAFCYIFQNLVFSSTAGTPGDGIRNNNTVIINVAIVNCKFSGFAYAVNGDYNLIDYFDALMMVNCEVSGCANSGVVNSATTYLIGCYFHDNTTHGFFFDGPSNGRDSRLFATRCVFYNNGGRGVYLAYGSHTFTSLVNCDFVSNTNDGLEFNSGFDYPISVVNCIFASNGGYGINVINPTTYAANLNLANAYYSNTSGAVSNASMSSASDVTLSASPFTAPASADFSLNSTAGGGTACKAVGNNGGTLFASTSSLDIGAVQSAGSGGGGGGTTTNYIVSKNVTQVIVEEGY